jgi:hypothetical protein
VARSAPGATTRSAAAAAALALALVAAGCSAGDPGASTAPLGAGQGPAASEDAVIVELDAVGGSVEAATATLEPGSGGGTNILLETSGGREAQPAHIRRGGCEGEEEIAFELPDVFDGISGETVSAELDELRSGEYAIDVHDPGSGEVTACAVIR